MYSQFVSDERMFQVKQCTFSTLVLAAVSALSVHPIHARQWQSECGIDGVRPMNCTVNEVEATLNGMKGYLLRAELASGAVVDKFYSFQGGHYLKDNRGNWDPASLSCSFTGAGTFQDYSVRGQLYFSMKGECGE